MNGTGEDSSKGATGGVVSMHKTPPPFCRLLFSLTLSTFFLAVGVDQTSGNFLIFERMSINQGNKYVGGTFLAPVRRQVMEASSEIAHLPRMRDRDLQ